MKKQKTKCMGCEKSISIEKIYRLSWRYGDKQRTYISGIKIIHTGYFLLCGKCLKLKIKN